MVCHSRAVNYVLGLSEVQMNRVHYYGTEQVNQLQMLSELGLFKQPLPKPIAEMPKLTDPHDASADLHQRALSYLHVNCSNCHVEAGGGNAQFSAEIDAKPEEQRLLDAKPVHATFGLTNARLVAPGQPDQSLLLHRISRRGHGQMPPMATTIVDDRAVELIREWIQTMPESSQ
jgi:mono/diheme cytochrome c family protein